MQSDFSGARHHELGGPGDEDTRPIDLATDRAWLTPMTPTPLAAAPATATKPADNG